MSCLDIPIPKCVQELIHVPPVCWPKEQDIKALALIQDFGHRFRCSEAEIEQACNLASGPSDLVVVLERPQKNQDYAMTFEDFVHNCKSLRAVDDLIRFCTKGARSIHTVTVIDALSFKPEDETPIPSEQCYQLANQVLELKKPSVIICCGNIACEELRVSQFRRYRFGEWPIRNQSSIGTSPTSVFRSPHPAAAVCYDENQKAYCRMLLICHFALAFAELTGPIKIPDWVRRICDGSAREYDGSRNSASSFAQTLFGVMGETRWARTIPQSAFERAEQRQQMNDMLGQLFVSETLEGAVQVAKLCLLWKDESHPAKQEIMERLLELGSLQEWPEPAKETRRYYVGFGDENSDVDLDTRLESLHIQDSESSIHQEDIFILGHQEGLSQKMKVLEEMESNATTISSRIQWDIRLQMSLSSHERNYLATSIADIAPDFYENLVEATAMVSASMPLLVRDTGISTEEDQLKRSLIQRPDGLDIVEGVIYRVEPLAHLAFRCFVLLSGLLAQRTILLPVKDNTAGGTTGTSGVSMPNLTDCGKHLEDIETKIQLLRALRKQLRSSKLR